MEKELAFQATAHKIRIYAQAFVMKKKSSPETRMEQVNGILIPVTKEYDEFDCPQLAVNYNGLNMKEGDFEILWKSLGDEIKKSMRNKGLL